MEQDKAQHYSRQQHTILLVSAVLLLWSDQKCALLHGLPMQNEARHATLESLVSILSQMNPVNSLPSILNHLFGYLNEKNQLFLLPS
jgi:hypothetical protein